MTAQSLFGISLSQGITRRHLMAYLAAAFISSGYAGAMAVLQPGLLQVLDIAFEQQGQITGMLSALQEVVFILLLSVIGALSDRIGRRPVYVFGLALTGIGFALYPQAQSLSELILYRLVVAVGAAAMIGMMVTVIADYATDASRGKANGLQGAVATLGAFLPPILGILPSQFAQAGYSELMAQQATFALAGCLGLVGAVVAYFGLAKKPANINAEAHQAFIPLLKQGVITGREPATALSYGAAFISRGDLAVTGAFMSLWLVQYGITELGLSASEAMMQLAVPRVLMVVLGAFVGSLAMGWLADRIDRVQAVGLAAALASCVYLSVWFITDPSATWVLGLLLIMGVAEISAFVSSQALVGQQAQQASRGSIIGFFGVCGAVGILIGTAGGGWLYSKISPTAPFVLFGILNGVVAFMAFKIARAQPAKQAEDQQPSIAST